VEEALGLIRAALELPYDRGLSLNTLYFERWIAIIHVLTVQRLSLRVGQLRATGGWVNQLA